LAKPGKPLTIVHDQTGSPTYAADLSLAILRLLENGSYGLIHAANSSWCSWYEFARQIVDTAAIPDVEITPVDTASLGRPALRPSYSVLNCQKLTDETGLKMRPWQEALREFLKKERVP
jgi:dTDP-4-dehydrorhamnose reductase